MLIKRLLYIVFVVFAGCHFSIKSAEAAPMSFAEYLYHNARYGKSNVIRGYMHKGYNIDAVDSNGMTALCHAVLKEDLTTYRRLLQLGASEDAECMSRVDMSGIRAAENQYMRSYYTPVNTASSSSQISSTGNMAKYAGIGLLAAGGIAAIALLVNDSDHHHHSGVITCPEGEHWEDGKCVPDGPAPTCPTGQKYDGHKCVDIICPENTHLVGNYCVADDVDKTTVGNEDVYGIKSNSEPIFNLYSSPKYPDDRASVSLDNTGNGKVYGLYGYSGDMEVFNAYVIGENDGKVNPKPVGVADISITDRGSGDVYGMYSLITDVTKYRETMNAAAWNNGKATGNININHTGGGKSYGIWGDVRAYNTQVAYGGRGYGNIDITGDGDIYGIFGYVAATNVVDYFAGGYGEGNINLTSTGNGDVYGIAISKDDIPGAGTSGQDLASWFAFNAISYWIGDGDVKGTINIHNTGNGNVYGMYGGQQLYNAASNTDGNAYGLIKIVNFGNGKSYGMYMPEKDKDGIVSNASDAKTTSIIDIVNAGDGVATGMRGGKLNRIDNSGTININNMGDGTAVGIYGSEGSKVANSGTINIYRDEFTDIDGSTYYPDNYSSSSMVGGTAYGIYAEHGATVTNSGTITITDAANGAGVYLETRATLENTGTISFNGETDSIVENGAVIDIYNEGRKSTSAVVDLDNLGGGEVILGQGGKFFASSLKGNMGVSEDTVKGSFDDKYTLTGALQANDVDGLNTVSKSAMFEAKTEQNSSGGYDVVLERKAFDALVNDASVAQFLESNYREGNNLELYDSLKSGATVQSVNNTATNYLGNDVLPSFRREDALVYRHFSRQFNESLFNKPQENYLGGYKYIDISRDSDGSLVGNDGTVHAAYGMVKGKASSGVTYGLGATISQIKSDYDNHSKRKSNLFGLWMPVGYDFGRDTVWMSKLYAGYEDGKYDRVTATNKFSSDINSYQYGVTNEVRHNINLGSGLKFTPAAELNLLGIYRDGFDEGSQVGAIHSDSANSLSLEGGLGAYLSKDIIFNSDNKLGIQIGGIYYVEFLDPDEGIDAHVNGMNGKYKLSHKYDRDRAVLSARVNYDYRNITLYGLIEQETGGAKAFSIDAGLQYNL